MSTTVTASRAQMILGLCIPLAVLIGFFLAEPFQLGSITILAFVAAVLTFPLVIRWHHPLLVLSWNAAITPMILPGRPHLWMLLSGISFLVALLNRAISDRRPFRQVSYVTSPLLALLGVVLLTAAATGGMGVRSLGAETHGGRGYFYILAAVLGYFALANNPVRAESRQAYIAMFFLGGLTYLLTNLAYAAGQSMWWMFYLVPGEYVIEQAMGDISLNRAFSRITSLAPASLALYAWLLARYGLRGILDYQRPWRLALFCLAWAACVYSGFRSAFGFFILLTLCQFFFEGLHRTRFLAIALGSLLVTGGLVVGFADRMPMVVQRTVSFLPVNVDPIARSNAEASTEWRLQMWRDILPEVPRYLLRGKGYAIDPNQVHLATESSMRGYGTTYQTAASVGDYHSGPLSVIIPFGVWGMLAFIWFLGASTHYLYGNYKRGDPRLRNINTLLLACFVAKTASFVLIFGAFYSDLQVFVGLVGLAACLNGTSGEFERPATNATRICRESKNEGRGPSGGGGSAQPESESI